MHTYICLFTKYIFCDKTKFTNLCIEIMYVQVYYMPFWNGLEYVTFWSQLESTMMLSRIMLTMMMFMLTQKQYIWIHCLDH